MSELTRVPIKPLQASIHGVGRYQTASDVGDLAMILMDRWPGKKGAAHRHAMVLCLEALSNQAGAEDARAAFVKAARAARISVLPDDAPKH